MDINYVTISQINRYIKIKLEGEEKLQRLYVKAEISNFKAHTRGHLYFTLKDDTSRIKAVMFSGNASKLTFEPIDGMSVLIEGRIGVYEPNGDYQLYVEKMDQDGIGNLYIEYEKLKKKLAEEGLFNPEHKKSIPKFPRKIGIITADTGAAIKDIISTIKRRWPIAETILFPTLVQGEYAKDLIVAQIETAQKFDLDVIICGRGGGSIEDLWAFNEEVVARAIFNSKIPIISAVGHEVDFTIADFVADLRAPTPTGAAEIAVPNKNDIINLIKQYEIRINESLTNKIKVIKNKLTSITTSYILKNPLSLYEVKEQKLDNYLDTLNSILKNVLLNYRNRYELVVQSNILKKPVVLYEPKLIKLEGLINSLKLLNPLNVLEKGYSVVMANDKIISNADNLKINQNIKIRFHKGSVDAKVERIEKNGK